MIDIKYEIGEKVYIDLLELEGYITGLFIKKDDYVCYEVSYFTNAEYHQTLFEDFELIK